MKRKNHSIHFALLFMPLIIMNDYTSRILMISQHWHKWNGLRDNNVLSLYTTFCMLPPNPSLTGGGHSDKAQGQGWILPWESVWPATPWKFFRDPGHLMRNCTHIIMQSTPSWKNDVKGKGEQKASKDKLSLWWQIFFNSFSDEGIFCRHYCPHADSTNLKAHTYLHLPRLRLSLLLNSPCSPFTHYFPIMGSSQHP